MTEIIQQFVDGLGRGGEYALIALGVGLIFGVMRLVNFAHGELITVSAYAAYGLAISQMSWWVLAPAIILTAIITSVAIEFIAFRWVRSSSDFAMLLTSFGVHFVVQAAFVMYVSASARHFSRPEWITTTVSISGIRFEVVDLSIIAATVVSLGFTVWVLQRTVYGMSIRAAAEDFDTARLLGISSERVIRAAFALAGLLAGIAALFFLMRTGRAAPSAGLVPMLKGVLAALIGGLGRLQGAVLGGLLLGMAEILLVSYLPDSIDGMVNGVIFILVAILFVFRPSGIFSPRPSQRV
ncbi:MAG: branched-chain amino acid ABC transporter permease [Acidimicrobiaceae bacterium]|nr:branched-chain amino acid ABC transporter permease [Acidimicrobiaceae bacterium]MDE0607633.1 branched-chain amino acid ABC transporter permease [Acidimicrobiaceae bacterium]